jgi:ParB family chromosome partitioning protein
MSQSDERGTPEYIIRAARAVMGGIDLDPASCEEANKIVQADTYYTKEDDGLTMPWFGRVWLNPPFSQPACAQFVEKAINAYHNRVIKEGIILVNVSTGKWYHKLLEWCLVVYPKHHPWHPNARIEFYPLPGNTGGMNNNAYGQGIFYLGRNTERFLNIFAEFCTVPYIVYWGKYHIPNFRAEK